MALIACPDCGKEVSDKASACIGCGAPLEAISGSKAVTPTVVSFDAKRKLFHGSVSLIAKLAVKAVLEKGWKVDSANESIGLITFQTGATWGSWSGVSGSISIEHSDGNFFEVKGSGKQNLAGGQVIALNIGNEAQKKVLAVVNLMSQLAPAYNGSEE